MYGTINRRLNCWKEKTLWFWKWKENKKQRFQFSLSWSVESQRRNKSEYKFATVADCAVGLAHYATWCLIDSFGFLASFTFSRSVTVGDSFIAITLVFVSRFRWKLKLMLRVELRESSSRKMANEEEKPINKFRSKLKLSAWEVVAVIVTYWNCAAIQTVRIGNQNKNKSRPANDSWWARSEMKTPNLNGICHRLQFHSWLKSVFGEIDTNSHSSNYFICLNLVCVRVMTASRAVARFISFTSWVIIKRCHCVS